MGRYYLLPIYTTDIKIIPDLLKRKTFGENYELKLK